MSDNFIIYNVNCDGSENTLWDCKYGACGVNEGAGVKCSDPFGKCRFSSIATA